MTSVDVSARTTALGTKRAAAQGGAASKFLIPMISGASMVYSQLLTALFGVFLAAFLGAEAFGSMNLARNIFVNALFLAPLGLDQALQRHLGETAARTDDCPELGWLRLVPFLLSSALVLFVVAGGAIVCEARLFRHPGFGAVLAVTLLALPFATDMTVMGGAYRGRYRPVPSIISSFLIQPTLRIVATLVLSLCTTRLWAAIDGTLISFLVAWLYLAHRGVSDFPVRLSALRGALPAALRVLRYGPILGLSTFLFAMAKTLDTTALGLFASLADVGRYSVVMMMCQLVGTVGNALGQTIGTSIASAGTADDRPRMIALLSENMELSAILAAPFCVGIAVWGSDIDLLLGPNYATAPVVFVIAATTQWFFTVAHSCSAALSMTGRHKTELRNNAMALVIEVAACFVLIPRFGMAGAALATCIMVLCLNLVRQVQIGRMLGDALLRWRFLLPLLLSMALALPLIWIGHVAGFRAWWLTGLLAATHSLVSFAAMLTFLTSTAQRGRLLAPLARVLPRGMRPGGEA